MPLAAETHYTTYGNWLPPQLATHGDKIDLLIFVLHVFMALLFFGWGIYFVYCLVKFRARTGHAATYEPVKGGASKLVEIAVIVFELAVLFGLSMPVWLDYKNKRPAESENPLTVHVHSKQFEWQFHYCGPDGKFGPTSPARISTSNFIGLDEEHPDAQDDLQFVNECHLPTGRPIVFEVFSRDVIHSLSIPTMRVKQDTIPGMRIPIWFTINQDATTARLNEDMVQKFSLSRATWYRLRHHISTQDYKSKAGDVILARDAGFGNDVNAGKEIIRKLREAGHDDVMLRPSNPLEIVCAQLCGNNHYTMKAQLFTHVQSEFDAWQAQKIADKNKEIEVDF